MKPVVYKGHFIVFRKYRYGSGVSATAFREKKVIASVVAENKSKAFERIKKLV